MLHIVKCHRGLVDDLFGLLSLKTVENAGLPFITQPQNGATTTSPFIPYVHGEEYFGEGWKRERGLVPFPLPTSH